MSDITLNFTQDPIQITITPTVENLSFTPNVIQATFSSATAAVPGAGGIVESIQYNSSGDLAGTANLMYYAANTTTVANNFSVLNKSNLVSPISKAKYCIGKRTIKLFIKYFIKLNS